MRANKLDEGQLELLTREELLKHQNESEDFFHGGFKTHTFQTLISIAKKPKTKEINIISVKNVSNNNEISLKYHPKEKRVIFILKDESPEKVAAGEVDFPDIDFLDGNWHDIVYRFGKFNFKLWIDNKIKINSDGFAKTVYDFPMEFSTSDSKFSVNFGNKDDIHYCEKIKFYEHPCEIDKFHNRCLSDHQLNNELPIQNFLFNGEHKEGTFHVLNEFNDCLKKYNNRGVFYTLQKSATKDVSEYFEDGILRDHTFELNYRVTKFPESKFSYYLILLRTSNRQEISIALKPDREILVLYIIDANNKILQTEYFVEQIFNSDWHTLKYTLKNKTFTLFVDGEPTEDYMGRTDITLNYDINNFLWHDTYLMLTEQESGLHTNLEIDFRGIKFQGNAITTSNNPISFKQKEKKRGLLGAFFKIFGIKKKTQL